MAIGLVLALLVFGGFLLWGAVIFVRRLREPPKELPSQASSHHESNLGRQYFGPPGSGG